jgi:IS5 family transposase
MWQKSLVTQANTDELGRETEQGLSFDRQEQLTPWTEDVDLAPAESCNPKPGSVRRLARLCLKLCSCLFHRWFNLYDLGIEEDLYISPLLRRFAGMDLGPATAPQETATLRSRNLSGQNGFLVPEYPAALLGGTSKSGIPWRSPWLYLSLLLLAWLFVL